MTRRRGGKKTQEPTGMVQQRISFLLAIRENIRRQECEINHSLKIQQEKLTKHLLCSHGYTSVDCPYVGIAFQLPRPICIDDTTFTHIRLSFNCTIATAAVAGAASNSTKMAASIICNFGTFSAGRSG